MTPPVLVAEIETTYGDGTNPEVSASFNAATGDVLVVATVIEGSVAADNVYTVAGGSLTYTLQQEVDVIDFTSIFLWTTVVDATKTGMTVTVTRTAGTGLWYGFQVYKFNNTDGVGGSSKANSASGTPSLALTDTQDNSAIVVVSGDWSAVDGAGTRVWREPYSNLIETLYFRDSLHYTAYGGYHPDTGPGGGTYTVGLTAPAGQKWSIAAVEVKGKADVSSPATPDPALAVTRRAAPMRRR